MNEEDTVTVGQDLVKMELGGAPQGGEKEAGGQEPKAPATESQATSSDPEPSKNDPKSKSEMSTSAPAPSEPKQEPPENESKPSQPKQETKSSPAKHDSPTPTTPPFKQAEPKGSSNDSLSGNREERRVSVTTTSRQTTVNTSKVKMNRMRLRIAERLKQSQNTAASLTTFNEVDMLSLMEFRKLYKDEVLKNTGVKLGFMSAFSRACILAMKDIPAVNASIEGPGGGDTIVYRDYVDISVAVATEKGLVTPVVRNTESLDLVGIERAIAELGRKVHRICNSDHECRHLTLL